MQAEHIGSHFSNNGPTNFISRPDCYNCKDASVDTHINATNVRHLSSVIADIFRLCQMSDVSDDRWRTLVASIWVSRECLCKCSNLVEKLNWTIMREKSVNTLRLHIFLCIFWDFLYKMKMAGQGKQKSENS